MTQTLCTICCAAPPCRISCAVVSCFPNPYFTFFSLHIEMHVFLQGGGNRILASCRGQSSVCSAPWISWLLLLQSAPFVAPNTVSYFVLRWVFAVPIVALDVKIYGQWFSKGKRFLSTFANPTSQLSVIGNLVGAQAAAKMGWKEIAIFLFSPGMVHYLVLFVHFISAYLMVTRFQPCLKCGRDIDRLWNYHTDLIRRNL